jgi:8-oxo-dGTP pyrophosphatase MutT (NUDIX family)
MHNEVIDQRLDKIFDCLYRISAKALITRDDKVLLVKEKEEWWSLPGGGVDHGETIETALKRELSEELSISTEVITLHSDVLYAEVGHIVEHIPRVALVYRVELTNEDIQKTNDVETYGWFSLKEVEKLYISPTVGGTNKIVKCLKAYLANK